MSTSERRKLTVDNHSRDSTGMRYVYAVLSRRARGVSIGINLNPNNACNWACNYCQVPNLIRGKGPAIDCSRLESELRQLLHEVQNGQFMADRVADGSATVKDIAFSGNGEPTTSPDFGEAVESVLAVLKEQGLLDTLPITVITNGSMLNKPSVLQAIEKLAAHKGRVWFKFDRATARGSDEVNGQVIDLERHIERLDTCASYCETWIQTCLFATAGDAPSEAELVAYLAAIRDLCERQSKVAGVLLYSLARASMQPQGAQLQALDAAWLDRFAARIRAAGMVVRVNA